MKDSDAARRELSELKAHGIELAIDDGAHVRHAVVAEGVETEARYDVVR